MRLINADGILWDNTNIYGRTLVDKQTIDRMPTIDPYNWISVKEDLPPCSGSYFVATKNGGVTITHFYESSQRFSGRLHRLVTHWMERPKAPEVKITCKTCLYRNKDADSTECRCWNCKNGSEYEAINYVV